MPLEIEVKLRAPSLAAVRESFKSHSAARVGLFHETNIFFDRPDRSLLAEDSGLRVRLSRKDGQAATTTLLTFKGPKKHSALEPREAFDVTVTPADEMISLLEALDFQRTHSFEKRRESWDFGGCKIELDELPALGTFVEIEGPSEETVLEVRQKLGLGGLQIVKTSYAAMVGKYVTEHVIPNRALAFGATIDGKAT